MLCSIIFIGVPPARVRLKHVPGAEGRLLHQNSPKASFWASRDTHAGHPWPAPELFYFRKPPTEIPPRRGGGTFRQAEIRPKVSPGGRGGASPDRKNPRPERAKSSPQRGLWK